MQKIKNRETGQIIAERELTYDESAETYHRPVFVAHLMDTEDKFLQETLEVTTDEKGE